MFLNQPPFKMRRINTTYPAPLFSSLFKSRSFVRDYGKERLQSRKSRRWDFS